MTKQEFLVCYDYGMGGLWGIMNARDVEQIRSVYPELAVIDVRPGWLSDERYARIYDNEWHDIDGLPWGILNAVLDDRRRETERSERMRTLGRDD